MTGRERRKRLEAALTGARAGLRHKLAALDDDAHARRRRLFGSMSALVGQCLSQLGEAQTRSAAADATSVPELKLESSQEAVGLAISALVNLALAPHVALEELLAELPDAALEALLEDLQRTADFVSVEEVQSGRRAPIQRPN